MNFFPEQASTAAGEVDALFLYLVAVSAFFFFLIFAFVVFFSIRYRRRSKSERPKAIHGNNTLEVIWTVIPLVLALSFFGWGLKLYYINYRPPANSLEIFVVGKQWMWKLQHPSGPREINELHVPVNYPVRLTITSEDVIHSFFVPAFRLKMDAVPGRYNRTWFKAVKPGRYHFFCAQYCGTDHSKMIGWVTVMEQTDYQKWISALTGQTQALVPDETKVSTGEKLFNKYRCFACHSPAAGSLGPDLTGVFGRQVSLKDGQKITADESYLKESVQTPTAKIVEGYAPLMPSFDKILSEEQIFTIIEYLKTGKKTNDGQY
ncbi:MAG: cytochrome c oxidase subunit II [Candidatus Omnitrophica bacterium CG1_02_46_14]|nr:MAG: cytochrome c oxidase subunit II [Candidatus Omnitrophica bacterium CG1_02_46_14]